MTLECEFKSDDLKKYLLWRQKKFNIILLVLATIIYFWIDFYMVIIRPFIIFIGYLLLLIILGILIYLFNLLKVKLIIRKNQKSDIFGNFKLKITKDKIVSIYNNTQVEFLQSNIKKIKIKKKYISIEQYHSKNLIILLKQQISEERYLKLVAYIKKIYIK